jgi:hypothetical protein
MQRFEFKGSCAGLKATEEEKRNPKVMLKDEDWLMACRRLDVGTNEKFKLFKQV